MRILLTGGAGDLGKVLSRNLEARGDVPVRFDVRQPSDSHGEFVQGSILDREQVAASLTDIDVVVHIAAWHGYHEFTRQKDVYEFWELNVTGTFYVFEAAVRAGINKVIFISSTSIDEPNGIYGHTKILGEEIARTYAARHGMNVITLRPRAFIPHWNRDVYQSYVEWAKWFWSGAVHIDDVVQAVEKSIDLLAKQSLDDHLVLVVDGAYDYADEDLQTWTDQTFAKYYPEYVDLVQQYGLDPTLKPNKLDSHTTRQWLGYEPQYSLRNLLVELATYGEAGPPSPFE